MNVNEVTFQPLTHPCSFHYEAVRIFKAAVSEDGKCGKIDSDYLAGSCEMLSLDSNNWAYASDVIYKKSVKYIFKKEYKKNWLHILFAQLQDDSIISYFEFLENSSDTPKEDQSISYGQYDNRFLIQPAGRTKTISIFIDQNWLLEKIWTIDSTSLTPTTLLKILKDNSLFINSLYKTHTLDFTLNEINNRTERVNERKIKLINDLIADLLTTMFPENHLTFSAKKQREIKGIVDAKNILVSDFKSQPATLDELAKISGLNRVKFQQLFKEIYGLSFYQYFQEARFKYARQLIELDNYNISEAAYSVGFKNLSYFSSKFYTILGVQPGELKKNKQPIVVHKIK